MRVAGSGVNDLSLLDGVGDFGKIPDIARRISLEDHQVGLHANGGRWGTSCHPFSRMSNSASISSELTRSFIRYLLCKAETAIDTIFVSGLLEFAELDQREGLELLLTRAHKSH